MPEAEPGLVPGGGGGLDNSLFQSSLEKNLQGADLRVWGLFQGGEGGKGSGKERWRPGRSPGLQQAEGGL